jgi:hypothetical protein
MRLQKIFQIVPNLTWSRHYNWQQSRGAALDQFTPLKCAPPSEDLVRVHPMGLSNLCNAHTRLKRQLHDPSLLS